MINKKESRQVRMDSWFFKLLSRDMKIKTQKTKINQQIIIKNNKKTKTKKIKAMGNIAPSMDHYPRNG